MIFYDINWPLNLLMAGVVGGSEVWLRVIKTTSKGSLVGLMSTPLWLIGCYVYRFLQFPFGGVLSVVTMGLLFHCVICCFSFHKCSAIHDFFRLFWCSWILIFKGLLVSLTLIASAAITKDFVYTIRRTLWLAFWFCFS